MEGNLVIFHGVMKTFRKFSIDGNLGAECNCSNKVNAAMND